MTDETPDDGESIDVEATDDVGGGYEPQSETWDGERFEDREQFIDACEGVLRDTLFDLGVADRHSETYQPYDRIVGLAIVQVGVIDGKIQSRPFHAFDPTMRTEQTITAVDAYNDRLIEVGCDVGLRDTLERSGGPMAGVGVPMGSVGDLTELFGGGGE